MWEVEVSELRGQPSLGCGLGFAPFRLTRAGDSSSGLLHPGRLGAAAVGVGSAAVRPSVLRQPPSPAPHTPSWEELTSLMLLQLHPVKNNFSRACQEPSTVVQP